MISIRRELAPASERSEDATLHNAIKRKATEQRRKK
jgi:hypothetical protein